MQWVQISKSNDRSVLRHVREAPEGRNSKCRALCSVLTLRNSLVTKMWSPRPGFQWVGQIPPLPSSSNSSGFLQLPTEQKWKGEKLA